MTIQPRPPVCVYVLNIMKDNHDDVQPSWTQHLLPKYV